MTNTKNQLSQFYILCQVKKRKKKLKRKKKQIYDIVRMAVSLFYDQIVFCVFLCDEYNLVTFE